MGHSVLRMAENTISLLSRTPLMSRSCTPGLSPPTTRQLAEYKIRPGSAL